MDNLPTRNNNPGDLRDPATGSFQQFNTPQGGFLALKNDLQGKITGSTSTGLTPQSSLQDFAHVWAPASDNNDPVNYANKLASQLGVTPDTPIGSLQGRINDFANAVATNEGYQGPQTHTFTPDEFAQQIKAKYPQYQSLDNADLTQRILAKYPQYSAVVDMSGATQQPQQSPSIGGFLGNVVQSGANFVGGIGEALLHPIQTVQNIGSAALGGVEKLGGQSNQNTQAFDNVVNYFKDRYGSVDNLKNTIYTDPVGFAADLSTVFTGAGGALKAVGGIAKEAGLADVANATKNLGAASSAAADVTNPLNAVGKVAGKVLPNAEQAATSLYQSALKPSRSLLSDYPDVVHTGLKNGIVLSENGLARVSDNIESLNNDITDAIRLSNIKGGLILTPDITNRLDNLQAFLKENDALPREKIARIEQIKNEFIETQGGSISTEKAQHLKQSLYRELKNAYGELKSADVEGRKALARGLKEEIAKRIPGLDQLNAKESELIGLQTALEQFVNRYANHQFIGLSDTASFAGGAAAGGVEGGLLAGLVEKAINNPTIKSRIAILLHKLHTVTSGSGAVVKPATRITTSGSQLSGAASQASPSSTRSPQQ